MGFSRVSLVLAKFKSFDAHVMELAKDVVLIVVTQFLEKGLRSARFGGGDLLGSEPNTTGSFT